MNANPAFARAIIDELVRSGVQELCLAPGARSTPLVLAAHAQRGLRITVHIDERGAGYFALGAARASGRPVAVLVTSGTAGANLLPAVIEAFQARVPLVVLTADRPPELHEVGANQTIQQSALYGGFARWAVDVAPPEANDARLSNLRGVVCRAVARARGPVAGPVHLNLAFREPFEPKAGEAAWESADPEARDGLRNGEAFVQIHSAPPQADPAALDELARRIAAAKRGLIIAGPHGGTEPLPAGLIELGKRTGFPVFADALSGLRFGHAPGDVVSAHDMLLADARLRGALQPDFVLRFGGAPTSKNLLHYLGGLGEAWQALVDDGPLWAEESGRVHTVVAGSPASVVDGLLARARGPAAAADPGWRTQWQELDRRAWTAVEPELAKRPFEGALAARLVASLPDDHVLVVGNSLPVRDVERFARAGTKRLRMLANRGASGIDGVTSTAFGAAHALGRPVTLLLGDLSALHDINAFLARQRLGIDVHTIVVNNGGGGIFEFLPVKERDPPFAELFVASHQLNFADFARAVGMTYRHLTAADALAADLAPTKGAPLTEVATDRAANVRQRKELEGVVQRAVEPILQENPHAD